MAKTRYSNGQIFLSVPNPVINLRFDAKDKDWKVFVASMSEGNFNTLCFEEAYDSKPVIKVKRITEVTDAVRFTGFYEIKIKPSETMDAWFE